MLDILTSIINTITSVIEFVINTITNTIQFLLQLPTMLAIATESIAYLPDVLIMAGGLVVKLIINR